MITTIFVLFIFALIMLLSLIVIGIMYCCSICIMRSPRENEYTTSELDYVFMNENRDIP